MGLKDKHFSCANVLMKMFDSRSNIESHFNAMLKAAANRIMFIIMLFGYVAFIFVSKLLKLAEQTMCPF